MKIIGKFVQKQAQLRRYWHFGATASRTAALKSTTAAAGWERNSARRILAALFPTVVPVIVNVGISGGTADGGG